MTTHKVSSDQSTQVSFPTLPKKNLRSIRRLNTSADILFNNKSTQMPFNSSANWASIRQNIQRPKSLNFDLHAAKFLGVSNPEFTRISISPSDMNLNSYSNKSGLTCNSSLISNNLRNGSKFPLPPYAPKFDEDSSLGSCKCFCNRSNEEIGHFKTINIHGKQGLSWRQLHMSRAKLKATSATSELLSGFAMVAMVELQINEPTTVPEWLFVLFAVCTTILVSVHIFALMISTYILPNIDAIAKMEICEMIIESPHERMRGFIEIAWAFSTVLGLFLFLVEVAILSWVKFWDYSFPAAIAATVIVLPMLVIFVLFAIHFYHSLVVYKCNSSMDDMNKLEDMKKQLDEYDNPV